MVTVLERPHIKVVRCCWKGCESLLKYTPDDIKNGEVIELFNNYQTHYIRCPNCGGMVAV